MSAEKYILKAEATRIVVKNDKGIVTFRKRYKRGDVLDHQHIDPAHLQALVDSGRVAVDDGTGTDDAEEEQEGPGPDGSGEGSGGDDDEESEYDKYDEMSYQDLQAEAKERTGNGGGSAEDLRARLREADAADAE